MPVYDGRQLGRAVSRSADAVVVGTGAGGAVAAAELAAAGLRVVMLEEGGYYTGKDLRGDPLHSFERLYRDGGLTGTLGPAPILVPTGCCVGGTTTVNSGTCYRTPRFVLELWEREWGLEGATELDEHFVAIERALSIAPVPDALYGPQNGCIEGACRELGWRGSRIPRNADGCLASGVCALGCTSDGKMAMSVSKIPEALRDGAELWVNTRAERILLEGRRALGVLARSATGTPLVVRAPLTVVACGAFHSPALLLASGIRSRWIGRGLHLHPATRVVARFPEPIDGWREVPQAYNIDEFIEDGVFIQGQFVPPALQAAVLPGFGHAHKQRMVSFRTLASFGALISDESSGRVVALRGSSRPLAWYRLQRRDTRKLLFGIARTAEAFFVAGAEEVYSGVAAKPILRNRREALALERLHVPASGIEIGAFHPMGTVRAGAPGRAACDPWGRLRGWEGLAIADASLFPTSNRINPQLTIMALAQRAARSWAAAG
ncbi:MAG: GMC family oxidoreductase N-terminal domain-containing protein [Myxococcota bacterium]